MTLRAGIHSLIRPILIRKLLALAGICLSLPVLLLGLVAHPARDPDRLRYQLAVVQSRALSQALEHYRSDCGAYPPANLGLRALTSHQGMACWQGPYLRELPLDPWGRPYLYSSPPGTPRPQILSLGADGAIGGHAFNSDLTSLQPNTPIPESPLEQRSRQLLLGIWIAAGICCFISFTSLCNR